MRGEPLPLSLHPSPALRNIWHSQEPLGTHLTWNEELLRAMQEVFAREQEDAELPPRPYGSDLGGHSSLFKRLEKVIQEQVSNSLQCRLQFPTFRREKENHVLGKFWFTCFFLNFGMCCPLAEETLWHITLPSVGTNVLGRFFPGSFSLAHS